MNAIIPLNIAALRVSQNDATSVVSQFKGRTAKFDRFPYEYQPTQGTTSTGDSIHEPLEMQSGPLAPLERGVHVHWELPDYFRQGHQQAQETEATFPAVPNRWLVVRYFSLWNAKTSSYNPQPPKTWLVESDYLSPDAVQTDADKVARPAVPVPAAAPAYYQFMGRVVDYASWNPADTTTAPASYLPGQASINGLPTYLTAIGFTGPAFSAYYPECQSVFGFWDAFADLTQVMLPDNPSVSVYAAIAQNSAPLKFKVSYQVVGWLADATSDPLHGLDTRLITEYNNLLAEYTAQQATLDQTPAQFFAQYATANFRWNFQADDVAFTLDSTTQAALTLAVPTRTLCAGVLQELVWDSGPNPGLTYFLQNPATGRAIWTDPTATVAVGNTTTEALAAQLKVDLKSTDNDPDLLDNYEYLLDAFQLGLLRSLEGTAGSIFSLDDALHTQAFARHPGGSLWVIPAQPSADQAAPSPDQEITLPLALAETLNHLNLAQKAYDQGRAALDLRREQLFMDWRRYVAVVNDGDPNGYGNFLHQSSSGELQTVVQAGTTTGLLLWQYDDTGQPTGLTAANAAASPASLAGQVWQYYQQVTAALIVAPAGVLQVVPAAPFWMPTDPVIVAESQRLQPVLRNGRNPTLNVRLSSELLTTLAVAGAGDTLTVTGPALTGLPALNAQQPLAADVQALLVEAHLLTPMLADTPAAALQAQGGSQNPAVSSYANFVASLQSAQGGASPLDAASTAGLFALVQQSSGAPPLNPQQASSSPLSLGFTFSNATASGYPPDAVAWNAQQAYPALGTAHYDPFLPLFMAWQVQFDPLRRDALNPADLPDYTPNVLAEYFAPDAEGLDYQYSLSGGQAGFTTGQSSTYAGSVTLFKKPAHTLADQIKKYIQDYPKDPAEANLVAAATAYEARSLVSQALGGFNLGQTLQYYIPRLPVENLTVETVDVTTPRISSAATANVADNWYNQRFNDVAPATDAMQAQYNFGPLRSGLLTVSDLEVVDVFGQRLQLGTGTTPLPATAALPLRPAAGDLANAAKAYLPPRLLAPSRLWFRWLSAAHNSTDRTDFVEVNSHPATSPVCGWLLPNHLDNSLLFYNADGTPIGSFGLEHGAVVYRTRASNPTPGNSLTADIGPAGAPLPTVNEYTAAVMWYLEERGQANANFLADLITTIARSEAYIQPAGYAQDAGLAVFTGRPLVIARAVLGLETSGNLLPLNQTDAAFAQAVTNSQQGTTPNATDYLTRQQAGSANLGNVVIPVRLGDLARPDDGLVGFLLEAAGATPYAATASFYAAAAPPAGTNGVVPPLLATLPLTLNAAPQSVLLLLDPRGTVHATTALLPVSELAIPTNQYAQAMRGLALTFFANPVLQPQAGLLVPLPPETGYDWSWVSPTVPARPTVLRAQAADDVARYSYSPQTLLEGWVQLEAAIEAT